MSKTFKSVEIHLFYEAGSWRAEVRAFIGSTDDVALSKIDVLDYVVDPSKTLTQIISDLTATAKTDNSIS